MCKDSLYPSVCFYISSIIESKKKIFLLNFAFHSLGAGERGEASEWQGVSTLVYVLLRIQTKETLNGP